MLELGPYEWKGHDMGGVRAAEVVAELVTLGERGRMISAAAARAGLSNQVITELAGTQEAIEFLQERLSAQDVVLVKGSRGMKMDAIVAALEGKR
jgi:UDP-N-acetylmuramoyl-tripeptide--D-alanyl-D-alanine ligase